MELFRKYCNTFLAPVATVGEITIVEALLQSNDLCRNYFNLSNLSQLPHKLKGRNCPVLGQAHKTTFWINSGWPSNRVFSSGCFILCFRILGFVFETINFMEEKSAFEINQCSPERDHVL